MASISLVLMFYFLSVIIYVLMAMVGFSSFIALNFAMEYIQNRFKLKYITTMFNHELNLISIANLIASTLIISLYFYTRNWILNNCIGVCIVLMFLKVLKIPNLKVATLLLSLTFVYDIFWVFGSESVFGENVMVKVATGVDLPIKLTWPYFAEYPI